jgi:hypothetical protein
LCRAFLPKACSCTSQSIDRKIQGDQPVFFIVCFARESSWIGLEIVVQNLVVTKKSCHTEDRLCSWEVLVVCGAYEREGNECHDGLWLVCLPCHREHV